MTVSEPTPDRIRVATATNTYASSGPTPDKVKVATAKSTHVY
jgi:hypothetical protein